MKQMYEQAGERWAPIEGFVFCDWYKYEVSDFGRVREAGTNKIIKQDVVAGVDTPGTHRYSRVTLEGGSARLYVHRLVAKAFVENDDFENKTLVDHIDRNRLNNHYTNLRWATPQENSQNRSIQSNNTSGVPGVYYKPRREKYVAQITVNRKSLHLGIFKTKFEASAAVFRAKQKHFGEFCPSSIHIHNS
jgi:hypothetical protein